MITTINVLNGYKNYSYLAHENYDFTIFQIARIISANNQ